MTKNEPARCSKPEAHAPHEWTREVRSRFCVCGHPGAGCDCHDRREMVTITYDCIGRRAHENTMIGRQG